LPVCIDPISTDEPSLVSLFLGIEMSRYNTSYDPIR